MVVTFGVPSPTHSPNFATLSRVSRCKGWGNGDCMEVGKGMVRVGHSVWRAYRIYICFAIIFRVQISILGTAPDLQLDLLSWSYQF